MALSHYCFADRFTLSDGGSIEGPVVKENKASVIVDLGFDLLRIPKQEIVDRVDSEASKDSQVSHHHGIYTQIEGLSVSTVSDLMKQVGPATVQIRTQSGLGSGFVIAADGYVITNNHVISGDHKISVILYEDGEKELRKVTFDKVELLAQSPLFDLALLKIDAEREFPFVPIAQRNGLEQGQEVFAVGSPLGLERTISQGIVSVRIRVVSSGMNLIQHTAQINPGNSGGPLFNKRGEVVGVNNLKIASSAVEGIGFAIPATTLLHFADNRDAYAFDPRNPNAGYRYLSPPGSVKSTQHSQSNNKK